MLSASRGVVLSTEGERGQPCAARRAACHNGRHGGGPITVGAAQPLGPPAPRRAGWRPQRHLDVLAAHGLVHLERVIPRDLCERVRSDYRAHCATAPDAAEHTDEHGLHARLANFHLVSTAALRVGTNRRVMRILDAWFGARACIYSSLTFERGTEQQLHSDAVYFCTEPPGRFLAFWVALEDVDPRAGPLTYHPGAHRNPVVPRPVDDGDLGAAWEQFQRDLIAAAEATGPAVEVCPQQGDVLIWHPDLPHGGAPVLEPGRTRASMVFHCVPEGTPVSGPDVFFGVASPSREAPPTAKRFGRRYVSGGSTHFAPDT